MSTTSALEAILFAAGSEGLKTGEIALILDCNEDEARALCHQLRALFDERDAGITIQEVAGTWQLMTRPEHAFYLKKMAQSPMQTGLSAAALEVLAIVAYKQPIIRNQIDEIRGVQSERAVSTLVHRQLIREVGRQDAPGRPILYGTTEFFLRHFGLKTLEELPPLPPAPEAQDISLFSVVSETPRD